MKTKFLQRVLWLLIPLLTLFNLHAWSATWTWSAASGDTEKFGASTASGTVTLNGKSWTFTRTNPNTCNFTSSCLQFGKNGGVETLVLSTSALNGTITKIDVECSSYKAYHKCKIDIGDATVKAATATASWTTVGTVSSGTISPGKTGTITITFSSASGARALYVKSITVTYTPASYNVDWYVGDTKVKAETGVEVGTPPAVSDGALGGSCSSLKFVGWSEKNIGSTPDDAPADLFPSDDVPALNGNKTFYAVFGDAEYDTDGTPVKTQTLQYDTWTKGGSSTDKSTYRMFHDGGYVQSESFDLSGLAKVIVYGGTFGGASYNSLTIGDGTNTWKNVTVSGSSETGTNTYTGGTALSGTGTLQVKSNSGTASNTGVRISKVEIFMYPQEYSNCVTACESCTLDPIVGAAALKGTFSLSSVGVTATDWSSNTNCSWTDYGFVWGTSANPTVSDNKVQVGTSGSVTTWDGNLSSSFTLGNTYYYRAYGKNGKAGATVKYSTDQTFTPRSVTFNLNGHGSSAPATQYVNNGGKATDPNYLGTDEDYTFAGWYKEAGCTNAWDFSTDVVSGGNKTLYAKWTAKVRYTVTLNNHDATTAGSTSISVTYGENTNLTATPAITVPAKTGYTFGGYYTEEDGGGAQVIAANGNVNASAEDAGESYTDASKRWIYNDNIELHAKWSLINYTITYNLNSGTNPGGAPTSYTIESSAITLPTPTREGYTFGGWYANSDLSTGGVQTTIAAGSTGNKEYWAKWTINNYTVSWMVNGSTWTKGVSASNNNANYGTTVSAPSGAGNVPTTSDCDDEKVFVGWTATEIGSTPTTAPADLFTTTSPAITENTTFYAVFATGSGSGAAVGTVVWKEEFTGFAADAKPTSPGASATVYSGATITYTCTDGSSQSTKIYDDNVAGSITPELMVGKGTTNGSFGIAGIPKAGASALTLTFKRNNNTLTPTVSGSGYSIDKVSGSGKDMYTYTITCGSGETFGLLFTGNNSSNVRLDSITVKVKTTAISYSDYVTSCGTCLPAPDPITIKVKSTQATLSWPAVADATGYTVTCKQGGVDQGSVSVVGTTATITGLTAERTYDFTVQSTGTSPYDCFPIHHGTFTTPNCDDVPTISYATATADAITVGWACEAATATLHIYSDEACSSEVKNSGAVTAKTATVSGLDKKTTYYFKVITSTSCPSMVDSIKTEETNITVVEWSTTSITFDFNDSIDATLYLEGRQTDKIEQTKYATGLFFSKYFEAGGDNKMLAIYNGTKEKIDLTGYFIQSCNNGGRLLLSSFGRNETGWIYPQEEIIFGVYDASNSAEGCTSTGDGHENWYTYTKAAGATGVQAALQNTLTFGGRTSVALYHENGAGDTTMIDIIGSYYVNAGKSAFSKLTKIGSSCSSAKSAGTRLFIDDVSWNDQNSYWTLNGDNVKTSAEETNYGISTNRCLLVRKNSVLCGDSAVKYNKVDADTLTNDCGVMSQTFKTLATEWSGYRIGAGSSSDQSLHDSTCTGFVYAGKFDYNTYYVKFDTIFEETPLGTLKNEDGDYVINGLRLDTLYCGDLRIDIKDKKTNEVYSSTLKVPMMVTEDMDTRNALFTDRGSSACSTCDVIIMKDVTLTKATDGAGDVPQVKDVQVYPGGKLVVPTGTNYTVNSISLRREEDDVSSVQIVGNLTVTETNGVVLDLRIDPSNWHFLSLPYDCNIDDIKFGDGTNAVYGTDFLVRWYDGQYRAANKSGGWKDVAAHATLKAGQGYAIGLMGSGTKKKELRFVMNKSIVAAEKSGTKYVDNLYAWGGDKTNEQLTPNHKGWNFIGNPFLSYYNVSGLDSVLQLGTLEEDKSTNPAHYVLNTEEGKNIRYVVVPNGTTGKSGYKQQTLGAANLSPFTAYFIQVGGSDPTVKRAVGFSSENAGKASIVRRKVHEVKEDNHPVWFGLQLISPAGESDNTTLLISDEFTDNYDMMDDLVKMRGSKYNKLSVTTAPVLGSRNNDGEMAFNALPDASASTTGVPVNYYAAQAGTFTFTLDSHYSLEEIKSAMLYDATAGQYYDLLAAPYEFYTAQGDNTNRFTLFVRVERKKAPEIATGEDNVLADGELSLVAIDKTLVLSGLTETTDVFVYDMNGRLIKSDRTSGNGAVWRTNVPAAGVYFVRVNRTNGHQTLRTIVK